MSDDFKDVFVQHVIKSRVEAEYFASWLLMRPNTGVFWCRITAADGLLRVSGDFDPIIFQGHLSYTDDPIGRVAWMGQRNGIDAYVCEKARTGSGRDACTAWDTDDAHDDLCELIRERKTELADEARASHGNDPNDWPDDDMCCPSLLAMQEGLDETLMYSGREGVHEMLDAIYMSNHEIEMEQLRGAGERPSQGLNLAHRAVQRLHELLTAESLEQPKYEGGA